MVRASWPLALLILSSLGLAGGGQGQGTAAHPPQTPVAPGGPFDRVYLPQHAPPQKDRANFPREWLAEYASPERNASFAVPATAPQWLRRGVSWQYAEARAWPLANPPYAAAAIGAASGDTTATQWMGNAVGVTAVDGVIYAQSDDQFVYAVNARTGQLIWRTSPVPTTWMGQPLVQGDLVYVNAGTVGFNFSNLQTFAKTGHAVRGAGVAYNGIYALDRYTGALRWHVDTRGDVMPTPALSQGRLIFSTGAGDVFAVDARSGQPLWHTTLGGMANMSSPAVVDGKVYLGMSAPALLYCLDAAGGRVLWKATVPQAVNTSLGDVSPAVAQGVVVTDAITAPQTSGQTTTVGATVMAFDAQSGQVLWQHQMPRGPKPPSYKGGVPMIHGDTVYVGSPVDNLVQALDLHTGHLRWSWQVPDRSAAGSARGPATYHDGALYIATVASVYAVDAQTGHLLGKKEIGGRFGIISPTIVGGTMYLGNSWDWLIALPLSQVNPRAHGQ